MDAEAYKITVTLRYHKICVVFDGEKCGKNLFQSQPIDHIDQSFKIFRISSFGLPLTKFNFGINI